jgi:hypothetical protein
VSGLKLIQSAINGIFCGQWNLSFRARRRTWLFFVLGSLQFSPLLAFAPFHLDRKSQLRLINRNWQSIHRLLSRATVLMQDLFRRIYLASRGVAWVDSPDQGKEFLSNKTIEKLVRSLGKIQYRQVEEGFVSGWDVSVLACLLPGMNWGIDISDYALQLGAISAVKIVRNNISHLSEIKVDQKSYDLWKKLIKTSLMSFGMDEDEVEKEASSGTRRGFAGSRIALNRL